MDDQNHQPPPPDPDIDPRFDAIVDRRFTDCEKWDGMETLYGLSPAEALPMWVADMDFRSPQVVQDAVAEMLAVGVYGYHGDDTPLREAVRWWMAARHGWQVAPETILTAHGLVNGTGHVVDALTAPGAGVAIMTPVYHAFAAIIAAQGRRAVEMPLRIGADGRFEMDLDRWEGLTEGVELLILCSPHNPGGRVWSREELRHVARFCARHDIILAADEIHHDIVFPGQTHMPMAVAAPEIADRLVMMTSASKTFNIAGTKVGNLIVSDPRLRKRLRDRLKAFGLSRNIFGMRMTTAAYGPEGADWVDALTAYLAGNARLFLDGMAAIPGVAAMPMEATYLAWIDFANTGLDQEALRARVEGQARIAPSHGPTFGKGGETCLRFNLGMPRSQVTEAVTRLQAAFSDLR